MSSQDTQTPASGPELSPAQRRELRRNYWAHCLEGGAIIGGFAFASPDTVLPELLVSLEAPSWMVALAPQSLILGFIIPPLLVAHWIETLPRTKPLVLRCGVFQRLPFLLAALALFYYEGLPGWQVIGLVGFSFFFSGIAGGITMTAWNLLVAKVIPSRLRTSSSAIRSGVGAFLGYGAGIAIEHTLTH